MCRLFLMTVALLAVLFGFSGLYMMPKLVQQKIEQKIQLKIGTKTFDRFTKIPIPLTVKFHFFNISNADQVLAGAERPQFQEVGPFIFKQWRRREIVDITDNNRKITYREYKTFYSGWPLPAPPLVKLNKSSSVLTSELVFDRLLRIEYLELDEDGHAIFPEATRVDNNNNLKSIKDNIDNNTTTTTTTKNNNNNNGTVYFEFELRKLANYYGNKTKQNTHGIILNPYVHRLTIVNLPLLTVLSQLAQLDENSLKRKVASQVLGRLIRDSKEKILVSKLATELLFDGYKVALMESADDLFSNTLGYNFDSPLPKNKFGFFYGKNNSWSRREAGEMTVFTGRNESMRDFMLVDNWNGLKALNVWPRTTEAGNRCNEVRGTDGSQFHPGVSREQTLEIFSPMICTSIFVKFKEDTSARDIPLLRFTTPPDVFGAPKKNSRNACYCTIQSSSAGDAHGNKLLAVMKRQPTGAKAAAAADAFVATTNGANSATNGEHQHTGGGGGGGVSSSLVGNGATRQKAARISDGRCYIDGLMDLSLCQRGAPIAASGPHFYNADPMLALAAGLKPQKHLHETYLDIEPMTGSVFRAASRAQLSAFVEQAALEVVDAPLIGHMTAMVAPLLWLEEAASIDEKSSLEFKGQLLNVVRKGRRTFYYAIAFGCLLALAVAVQFWYFTCYKIDTRASGKGGGATTATKVDGTNRKKNKNTRGYRPMSRRGQVQSALTDDDDDDDGELGQDEEEDYDEQEDSSSQFRGSSPYKKHAPGVNRNRSRRTRGRSGSGSRLARNLANTPLVASGTSAKSGLAVAAIGMAVVAGAADASATANQTRRPRDRNNRRAERRNLNNEAGEKDEEEEEDQFSKRALVENEWMLANQSTGSGENSSPVASTSGGESHPFELTPNKDIEPTTGASDDDNNKQQQQRRDYNETDFD